MLTLGDAVAAIQAKLTRLEAVNAELVEALGVFADPLNWAYDRDLPRQWDNREIKRPCDFAKAAIARAMAAEKEDK